MGRRAFRGAMDDLPLAPGERVVGVARRNLFPAWAALALVGMALVAYGVSDERYGWGVFFLGIVALAFVGSLVSSTRYVVTDRRVVRTGWRGRKEVARGTIERQPGAFGETLVVRGEGASMTVRFVTNAGDFVR